MIGKIVQNTPAGAAEVTDNANGDGSVAPMEKRVCIEASEGIELRCGESVIKLDSNGKITILGKDVTTRARKTNKIKGASVRIN